MGGRRLLLSAIVCLVALVGGACAEGGDKAETAAPADLMGAIEELCAPAAEAHEELYEVADEAELEEAAEALSKAEAELAERLRELDPPDEVVAYADALEEYAGAEAAAGEGGSERARLESVVAAAEADVRLDEVAAGAGLPDACPPPSSVDVDNNLFVAQANLECFGLIEEAGGEPFDAPRTAKEITLMIDLARRLTVGIARAVKDSAGPGVEGIPVGKIVGVNKKRFHAINALAKTFEGGDYGVYRKAGRKLMKVSRKADRKMLSVGLVYCAKAFNLIPL